jgi:hypothetical protein
MLMLAFLKWWYGRGWAQVLERLQQKLLTTLRAFSVGLLLRTLFAPWRRIVTYPGAGLAEHLRAVVDNLVSRCVGFVVRSTVLIGAGCTTIIFGGGALVLCIVWPLLPLLAVTAIVWGLLA